MKKSWWSHDTIVATNRDRGHFFPVNVISGGVCILQTNGYKRRLSCVVVLFPKFN